MAFAMFTEPVNGVSDVTLIRHGRNKVEITTPNTQLSDDQARDLYWIILQVIQDRKDGSRGQGKTYIYIHPDYKE